jgi:hypothetical protein
MQIVLCGQPGLAGKLASRNLAQLRQRISVFSRLAPLSVADTQKYIEHRLKVAGHSGPPAFSAAALEAVAHFSKGIPRNINTYCFNALSLGCALRQRVVDSTLVEEVNQDLDISEQFGERPQAPATNGEVFRSMPRPLQTETNNFCRASEFRRSPSVDEAKAHMRQVVARLRWEQRSSTVSWLAR